jgi:hypothetical protein
MATNSFAPVTSIFQDLERMQFAQNLRRNPSDYNAYVNSRVDQLSNEVFNRKRTAFQKAHIDLGRYMDMDHNANYYKARSGDVDRLTNAMSSNNARIAQGLLRDKDVSRRQFEINEWYNYNKLETLFFLQVFFISSLSMAIIIYLQKNSAITNALASLLTGILLLIIVGVGLYRYFYTTRTRDQRLWHRRDFGTADKPKPASKCASGGDLEFNINSIIPEDLTQCADEVEQNFDKWQSSLEKEMLAYQTTGATPSRITGNTTLGGKICKNLA